VVGPGVGLDRQNAVLLATLGGQPQIVTFALDGLLAQGSTIQEVIVVHPAATDQRLRAALDHLAAEFAGQHYVGHPCRYRTVELAGPAGALDDIPDEDSAEDALNTIHALIRSLKRQRCRIHACISGGLRIMALLTISAAMLHFDHQDRLWHVYTPPIQRERADEGATMHAAPSAGVRLIEVPLVPWGAYFPALRDLASANAGELRQAQVQHLDRQHRERCRQVLERLTRRQREVVRAFADGLHPDEVAERLALSLKTVDSHKTRILEECRIAWGLDEHRRLDYRTLHRFFDGYFERQPAPSSSIPDARHTISELALRKKQRRL
jgi:CRISPR-associated protein Csx14